ncbi:sulfite exporter TauE/SafE family protein [Fictibacillus iocasae]|uniref:Probable membrane transporter protein n=1 Tax=Fictibacillus iocasae TaxID=2715437 RepID=A0ABW2NNW4_9BACL
MLWLLLFLLGLSAGTLGSIIGLGGGILIVPGLLSADQWFSQLPDFTPQTAVGTSIVILIVTGLSATRSFMADKRIDFKSGWLFFLGSGPGSFAGAAFNERADEGIFFILFGSFMLFVSLLLIVRDKLPKAQFSRGWERTFTEASGTVHTYRYPPVVALLISFVVGVVSGLFGIGGGSLMVPAMMLLFGFPVTVAVATSMFMIFLSSITGSIAHVYYGNVVWQAVIALVPGAYLGGRLGAYIHKKLPAGIVVTMLLLILAGLGLRFIILGV